MQQTLDFRQLVASASLAQQIDRTPAIKIHSSRSYAFHVGTWFVGRFARLISIECIYRGEAGFGSSCGHSENPKPASPRNFGKDRCKVDATQQRFFNAIDLTVSQVKPYQGFIFLCGGPMNIRSHEPTSIRDAICRELSKQQEVSDRIRVAEHYKNWAHDSHYKDLLSFERHLAELSSVIVLVLESAGSIAELGLFSIIDAFKDKLLVFVETAYYRSTSFIRLGPIDHLEKVHNNTAQYYRWTNPDERPPRFSPAIAQELQAELAEAVMARAEKPTREHDFSSESWLDVALLLCEVLSLCSALTIREIKTAFDLMGIQRTEADLKQVLFTLEIVHLVAVEPKGDQRFYVSVDERAFLKLHTESDSARFRSDQVARYRAEDKKRFNAIRDARARHAIG